MTSPPVRCARVLDHDAYLIVLTLNPERALVDSGTLSVTLTPGEAAALEDAIFDATQEPDRCVHCESFAVITLGDPLCRDHARALVTR